jgi:transcription elongation factor SPT5
VGAWVRLKRSIYKDDLAKVDQVDTAQNQVTLKLVPRIDYTVKRGALRDPNEKNDDKNKGEKGVKYFGGFKRKLRPAQRLFDVDAVKETGGMPVREKDTWIFENNRYTAKGYLIKSFPLSMVMNEGVRPSLAELQRFEELPDGVDSETAGLLSRSNALDKSHNFQPGDVVEVCSGELVHLTGSVIGIDGDKIKMVPNHEELKVKI